MRGNPMDGAPEHRPISTTPKARVDAPPAPRVSTSQHPAPKVLMGEVMAPKGAMIAAGREAFRTFMRQQRLTPTEWARKAGIPPAQVLAFLAGQAREIPRASLEKLAAAAGTTVDALLPE